MTFEAVIGIVAVLALIGTIVFFAWRRQERESQEVMEAYEAGDRTALHRWVMSGVLTLGGIVAMIGYQEGVEGVITVAAVVAVMGGLACLALCAPSLRPNRPKGPAPSSRAEDRIDGRLLFGGVVLAIAAFAGGTATLVAFHGATTIIVFYVVVPLMVGLVLSLRWSYRRVRRKISLGGGPDDKQGNND